MPLNSHLDGFDPMSDEFTRRIVLKKIKQILSHPSFDRCDGEDLYQELMGRLIRRLDRFDADVGHLYGFIGSVVARQAINLIRERCAKKRGRGKRLSLSTKISSESCGPIELSQTIEPCDLDRRLGRDQPRSESEISDLRIDLENVIAELPEPWRKVLELRATYSITEISNIMGVPSSTLNSWFQRIKDKFIEAGLEEYFRQ